MAGYERLVIVGGPGSGKSTTAAVIGRRLGLPHVELDSYWWQPGWRASSQEAFAARVREAISQPGWVLDGNYFEEIARFVWPAADAVVWLDLDRRTAIRRVLTRATVRVLGRRVLWNGNRESWRNLSPASIGRLIRNWPGYPARIEQFLRELDVASVIRLRTQGEVRQWLSSLGDRTWVR